MLRTDTSDLDKNGVKGDWCFMNSTDSDGNHVEDAYICLMWGDDSFSQMAILPIKERKGLSQAVWNWNGNKEVPTLTPSILVRTTKPHSNEQIELFHGFLTDGKIVHC